MEIDLNCDLGEGAGADEHVMPLITSANVACGFHAGGPLQSLNAIRLAKSHGVVVGAHPGHRDPEHFGRRELNIDPEQVCAECVYQIGALVALAKLESMGVAYVKPHGGLYHQACREDRYADAILRAAQQFGLAVMGLPGSRLEALAPSRCRFIAEGFADRRYLPDGNLVPRDRPGAFMEDPLEAVTQVEMLIAQRGVRTICVHGDNPRALQFVQALRTALIQKDFQIRPFA